MSKETVHAALVALAEERTENTPVELVKEFPSIRAFEYRVMLGSFAWFVPEPKYRVMLSDFARIAGATYVTPSERARDYLKYMGHGKKKRRVTTSQYQLLFPNVRPKAQPLYAIPTTHPDAMYIDVKSAYWSIMSVVGWDVDYFPGKWLAVSSSLDDFPYPDDKIARNSLLSSGISHAMQSWDGSTIKSVSRYNPLSNRMLWEFTQDVLHGVASDMVSRAGAFYVNTDGYIIPSDRYSDAHDVLLSWGLPANLKGRGATDVRGVGDYDIGERVSGRRALPRPFDNLKPRGGAWLRKAFIAWVMRVNASQKGE